MNKELFEKIKSEILLITENSRAKTDTQHAKSVCNWVLKLKPESDYALQIAALAHDIERGVYKNIKIDKKFEDYDKHKQEHSQRSADLIKEILIKHNLNEDFISKVYNLVLNHEIGGDEETDILKKADSISYFQDNIDYYLEKYGLDGTKLKIKYMFDRVDRDTQDIIRDLNYNNKEVKKFILNLK